jgi:uncharacterized protein YdaU (DUF1376 family)
MSERLERMSKCLVDFQGYERDPAVIRMSQQQEGAFFRLIRAMWWMPSPGFIEDDDALLREITRTPLEEWPETRAALGRYYDTKTQPGFWIDHLMVESYRTQTLYHEKQVARGKAGARKRWGDHGAAIATLLPKHSREDGGSVQCSSVQFSAAQDRDTHVASPQPPDEPPAGPSFDRLLEMFLDEYPKRGSRPKIEEAFVRNVWKLSDARRVIEVVRWLLLNDWNDVPTAKLPSAVRFLDERQWQSVQAPEGE